MSTMSDIAVVIDAAHDYIDRGWHVLAVKPAGKDPYFPLAPKAYLSATTDHELVDTWFDKHPTINIGVSAIQSGLVIVDIDHRDCTKRAWELEDQLAAENPTYTVKTGNGWHFYYRDPGIRMPGKITNGIDIKHKGYVVAAPSLHPSGSYYRTTIDIEPAAFPTWLLEHRRPA